MVVEELSLKEFLDGQTLDYVLRHWDSDSLLPMLGRILTLCDYTLAENENLTELWRFSEFAASCRSCAKSFQSINLLTKERAIRHQFLISRFVGIINSDGKGQPLEVLKFIFHRELGVSEHAETTRQLILTVLADLPFVFENWANVWIGIIVANWGIIWEVVKYVRLLENQSVAGREPEWRSKEGRWVSVYLAEVAGVSADLLLGNVPHGEPNQVDTVPRFTAAVHEPDRSSSSTQPQQEQGRRRVLERQNRPRAIYYPPAPSPSSTRPSPTIIDKIVNEYAVLPRLKYDEQEERRQELARRQKSEEEFNRKLKRSDEERKLRENLKGLASSGQLGDEAREKSHLEAAFRNNSRGERSKGPGVVADALEELRRKMVAREQEIEDDEFERWARDLLKEGEEKGSDSERYSGF
ncbi:hypothetical protein ABW20_dc0107224 [Dactylellina cionopaga]|nr:hypothetical protein ABW20_dc0107224 [Dactylellina cionopaga]